MNIRTAGREDAPAIAERIRELAASVGESSPVDAEAVRVFLDHPECAALVAELDGRVAGVLSYSIRPNLYHAGPSCVIEELAVAPGDRSSGIGGALLTDLMERMRAIGCAEVSVTVLASNHDALRFYRRHGLTDEAIFLERHL